MHQDKMKQIIDKLTQRKFIFFYIFTGINLIIYLIAFKTGNRAFSFESQKANIGLFILSLILILAYFAFCVFMRVKKCKALSYGIFYYQLLGFIFFIITFIALMSGKENSVRVIGDLFNWWSMPIQPFSIIIARFTGTKLRYIVGIVYIIITYITGVTVSAIKKDIAYEKQYAEDHQHIV